jgi:parallel beta-helix repeat protein
MKKQKYLLLFLIFVFSIFFVKAYDDNGIYFTCYSCADCVNALNNNTRNEVRLGADIIDYAGTCIDNPENFSNKIFDCQGHTIDGDNLGEDYGIYLINKQNNTIKNCVISGFYYGILLSSSNNNTLTNNTANNNNYGILLYSSSNNTLINNIANYNSDGIYLWSSSNNIITNNTVNNNSDGIILDYYSNHNTITNNTVNYNSQYGIYLWSSSNNTITNSTVNNNSDGIYLSSSSNNTLTSNIIKNCSDAGISLKSSSSNNFIDGNEINDSEIGIDIDTSPNNIFRNNKINNNTYNFAVDGEIPEQFYQDIDTSNLINGKVIYYWTNCSNAEINEMSNVGFVALVSCQNITIKNLNLNKNDKGILLINTTNTKILNNNLSDNVQGIVLLSSDYNTIYNNLLNNNSDGIYLSSSSNYNTITKNIANNNNIGIYLSSSSNYNSITNNTAINNNNAGIYLNSSNYNTLTNNIANNNTGRGIDLEYSKNNNLMNNIANYNSRGIVLQSTSDNNILVNNVANYNSQDGIFLFDSFNNNLINNIVNNNEILGVYLFSSNYNTLTNNTANNNAYFGIYLSSSSNYNTLTNNIANNNIVGIYLDYSSNYNTITNNIANNNSGGIHLDSSNYNTLVNNVANYNSQDGIFLFDSSNNNLTNNTINNNQDGIYLYASSNNNVLENNILKNNLNSGILFVDIPSGNNVVTGNNLDSNSIYLYNSPNNKINNNAITKSFIEIFSSSYVNVTNNNISLATDRGGIIVNTSSYCNLINNTISNSDKGFFVFSSSGNNITNNTIIEINYYAFHLANAQNNVIKDIKIIRNKGWDFYSEGNSYNNIATNFNIGFVINFTAKDVALKNSSSVTTPNGYGNIGKFINATNNSVDSWLYLNISYDNPGYGSTIRIARYNGTWETNCSAFANNCGVDATNKIVYANITKFSIFSPLVSISINFSFIDPTPTNNSYLSNDYIYVKAFVTDNLYSIQSCLLELDGANISMYKEGEGTSVYCYVNKTNVSDGLHNFKVYAFDTAGNSNVSETRYVTTDTIKPDVTLVYPSDNATINSTSSIFKCNATDNLGLKNISIYTNLSGVWAMLNYTNVSGLSNESEFSIDVSSYYNGVYKWACVACDYVNCNTSENRTFVLNKAISIIKLEGYINKDLQFMKFYNNLTLHAILESNEEVLYANFSLVDPDGVIRINNENGTRLDNSHWIANQGVILNVSGQWMANVTVKNAFNYTANKTIYFNVTDQVGWLTEYKHSLATGERGTNLTYILTLWHDSDECFRFTLTPHLEYGENFTVYLSENDTIICTSSIENPKQIEVKIYVHPNATDGSYKGNITINRTNTSTIYLHNIGIEINPPTAQPQLLTSQDVICNQSLDPTYGYWSETVYVGMYKLRDYKVKNIGDYIGKECYFHLITNESNWDLRAPSNFTLDVNETKTFTLALGVTGGAGTTKQAYLAVTCNKSTSLGFPSTTLPENQPPIVFLVAFTPQPLPGSGAGGGGGGGGEKEKLPAFQCLTGNISWVAKNERGGGEYVLYMRPNKPRNVSILFENKGKATVTITASCYEGNTSLKNICNGVEMEPSRILLEPTKEIKTMNVVINPTGLGYKDGDKEYFSIFLKDNFYCSYYFPITIIFSKKADLFSVENLINKISEDREITGKGGKKISIPVWLIFILILAGFTTIFWLLYKFVFLLYKPIVWAFVTALILTLVIYVFLI